MPEDRQRQEGDQGVLQPIPPAAAPGHPPGKPIHHQRRQQYRPGHRQREAVVVKAGRQRHLRQQRHRQQRQRPQGHRARGHGVGPPQEPPAGDDQDCQQQQRQGAGELEPGNRVEVPGEDGEQRDEPEIGGPAPAAVPPLAARQPGEPHRRSHHRRQQCQCEEHQEKVADGLVEPRQPPVEGNIGEPRIEGVAQRGDQRAEGSREAQWRRQPQRRRQHRHGRRTDQRRERAEQFRQRRAAVDLERDEASGQGHPGGEKDLGLGEKDESQENARHREEAGSTAVRVRSGSRTCGVTGVVAQSQHRRECQSNSVGDLVSVRADPIVARHRQVLGESEHTEKGEGARDRCGAVDQRAQQTQPEYRHGGDHQMVEHRQGPQVDTEDPHQTAVEPGGERTVEICEVAIEDVALGEPPGDVELLAIIHQRVRPAAPAP